MFDLFLTLPCGFMSPGRSSIAAVFLLIDDHGVAVGGTPRHVAIVVVRSGTLHEDDVRDLAMFPAPRTKDRCPTTTIVLMPPDPDRTVAVGTGVFDLADNRPFRAVLDDRAPDQLLELIHCSPPKLYTLPPW